MNQGKNKKIIDCKKNICINNNNCCNEFNVGRFFLGMAIILIGSGFLLNNLGFVDFSFNFWKLWPLFIIFIGLSIFDKKSFFGNIVGALALLISIFFVLVAIFVPISGNLRNQNIDKIIPIAVPIMEETKSAKIDIVSGVGQLNLSDTSESGMLVSGILSSNFMQINPVTSLGGSVQKVSLEEVGKTVNSSMSNELTLNLNQEVPMDIILHGSFFNMNIDLSNILANNVDISSGASSLSLKLGSRVDSSTVNINAGTGSADIFIPNGVGVFLKINSGLSTTTFTDFKKINDNTYESNNYANSNKKINLNINIGLSSLNINWYSEPIIISDENTEKIELFYYNKLEDKENSCGSEYVLPISRQIPATKTPIKDAINLLLSGQLTQSERNQGFVTEFPNDNFKLLDANYNYDNETLTLSFTEVPGFSNGGSCRVGIIENEIIKTAKQFGVKNIVLEPESIFQP